MTVLDLGGQGLLKGLALDLDGFRRPETGRFHISLDVEFPGLAADQETGGEEEQNDTILFHFNSSLFKQQI